MTGDSMKQTCMSLPNYQSQRCNKWEVRNSGARKLKINLLTVSGKISPVKLQQSRRQNYICTLFKNFQYTELYFVEKSNTRGQTP